MDYGLIGQVSVLHVRVSQFKPSHGHWNLLPLTNLERDTFKVSDLKDLAPSEFSSFPVLLINSKSINMIG